MYRQGDCLLIPIDKLPTEIKKKDKTIAYGEITGHHHRFESKSVQVFEDVSNNQFVQVESPSKLIHEEHKELEIPKGNYKVVLQREYDLVSDSVRNVMD